MVYMFNSASSFNKDISNWDTGSVLYMGSMFGDITNFNQDISGWDTSSVINMNLMFRNCSAFDQDLSSWDVNALTTAIGMFDGSQLSTANYDALLNGWSAQSVETGLDFDGGSSTYCQGQAGRDTLTGTYGWQITDGGFLCLLVKPSNLTAAANGKTEVSLSWTDNSDNEDAFKVERSPAGADSWMLLTTTLANATSYTDIGVVCGTSYDYRVSATNTAGYSDYATTSTATDACVTILSEMFYSQAAYDGWVLETGEKTNKGGLINTSNLICNIGDDALNRQYRTILHFNTSRIPDSAVITKITLQYKLHSTIGSDPYATHGKVWADIKDGFFSNNPGLVVSDFAAGPSMGFAGYFVYTPSSLAYSIYRANLKDTAFQHLNISGITQFRLRFAIDDDNDNTADYLKIFCGDMPVPFNRPVLRVWFYVP